MIIVDSHQDLAWNILNFGRDYTRSAADIRRSEAGTQTPTLNGDTLLGWPDYIRGNVALVFVSLFATPIRYKHGDWDRLCFGDTHGARRLYSQQLDVYHRLCTEHPDRFQLVGTSYDLQNLLSAWEKYQAETLQFAGDQGKQTTLPTVGLLISMESAEAVGEPAELEYWWEKGVRIIGPAWTGTRYCGGTYEPGPLTKDGFALLHTMDELGFGLDLSHMDETAALQALDIYQGKVLASHSNVQALLKGIDNNRHLTDRVIRGLVEREAVIGVVPYNDFLKTGWKKGASRLEVTLLHLIEHIDYICQVAGNAKHAAIGSDFDGGFGVQSTPAEIDTIADLQLLTSLLAERGYAQDDIEAIMGNNWLSCIRAILSDIEQ